MRCRAREATCMGVATGFALFDNTIRTTTEWLSEIRQRMKWHDRCRAYHALRVVLHALRDRLTDEEVVTLGGQLPMLVRGCYYEGWHPHDTAFKDRKKEAFLAQVREAFQEEPAAVVEETARAVFEVIAGHVRAGEMEDIKRSLPIAWRQLWP